MLLNSKTELLTGLLSRAVMEITWADIHEASRPLCGTWRCGGVSDTDITSSQSETTRA